MVQLIWKRIPMSNFTTIQLLRQILQLQKMDFLLIACYRPNFIYMIKPLNREFCSQRDKFKTKSTNLRSLRTNKVSFRQLKNSMETLSSALFLLLSLLTLNHHSSLVNSLQLQQLRQFPSQSFKRHKLVKRAVLLTLNFNQHLLLPYRHRLLLLIKIWKYPSKRRKLRN